MTWRLAVFDWDGTLVDTTDIAYRAMITVFDYYGLESPSKDVFVKNITSGGMLAFYHDRGVPGCATRQDLNAIWKKFFNDPKNHNEILLRTGARDVLLALRISGVNTAIVSGSTRDVIVARLKTLCILDLIDNVWADAVGKIEELKSVLSHFSVEPKNGVYIDDTFEGLSAAKIVGMSAIGITGGFGTKDCLVKARPNHIVSSLMELPMLFNGN